MHIVQKLSDQMNMVFNPDLCEYIQRIEYVNNSDRGLQDVIITFVYNDNTSLLRLCFKGVHKLVLERNTPTFELGELLFYDSEGGTPLTIADELGGFSLVCLDAEFVDTKVTSTDWVYHVG